ncbi:Universal stress protein family [Cystobacter fuscus DSM 2262]|uniref:Universal stress protein n=1 Tax=Cystobacter fuscus (strain ATCC 25194 / DSM 2262 / NBRC 100088 / M29) TaxID=1242864 RepID=S9QNV7_CYSF2|nr:universal stress protein [Cystobacter fuscus]EPX58233.1 Universal stress protein family [Cystobacter fuscus DSM 2262]
MSTPTRILVPVDLMEGSQAIVEYAVALGRPFNAAIEVLHVWEPPQYVAPDLLVAAPGWTPQPLEKEALAATRQSLENFVGSIQGAGTLPLTQKLVMGEPSAAVIQVAESGGFNLIVMGTHGRRGLPRLLLGSVAQRVVSRAPCPVLTLHVPTTK